MSGGAGVRTFSCVEASEVSGSVDDDTLHWHVESEVETLEAIGFEDLADTVSETAELSLRWTLADVSGQPRSGEVEWIDEAERGRTSCAARCQVTGEVTPELCFLIHAAEEDLLILVFEGEVKSLGGEVSDDVGQVSSPEGNEPLFFRDSDHTVHDSLVLCLGGDLFAGMLDLQSRAWKMKGDL